MTLIPTHPITRVVALCWLLACLAFLLLTLLRHDLYAGERGALTLLVPVYFLAFPFGHVALLAVGKIKLWLYLQNGADPSLLSEALALWTLTVLLGYMQWFMLLPWLSRRCWQCFSAQIPPWRNKK